MNNISYADFEKIYIRTGTIIEVADFPQARKLAYQLLIDFGQEIGLKRSSAQITKCYTKAALIGKQILAVVNFPEKQIGPFKSQVLVLGVANEEGEIVLVEPEVRVPTGGKLL